MVETLKRIVAAGGGVRGVNTHILMFPATTKGGQAILDSTRKAKLTLVLKSDSRFEEAVLVWHTPFDATTPVPPCHQCNEHVSAKWSYCPWCGTSLGNK